MSEVLYKYTTLESLALILKSKKIRLNPLTKMDDLQEAESADTIKYAPYVFISSWMDQPLESIAMWKLYSNMESGVRIALRRNPFERYTATKENLQKAFCGIEVQGESIDLILPPEQCFNEKYFLLNPSYCQTLEKVQYTDDPKLLSPKLFDIKEGKMELHSAKLGRYKNSYWEFQNEERYVLRFLLWK